MCRTVLTQDYAEHDDLRCNESPKQNGIGRCGMLWPAAHGIGRIFAGTSSSVQVSQPPHKTNDGPPASCRPVS
jgi:hypothetical protein